MPSSQFIANRPILFISSPVKRNSVCQSTWTDYSPIMPCNSIYASWTNVQKARFMPYRRKPGNCRHCGTAALLHARRLCWQCYKTRSIVSQYPTQLCSRSELIYEGPKYPCRPTTALPGSVEKQKVMMERYVNQQPVHHKDDPKLKDRRSREM